MQLGTDITTKKIMARTFIRGVSTDEAFQNSRFFILNATTTQK